MKVTSKDLIAVAEAVHQTRERFTRAELAEQLRCMGKGVAPTTLKIALARAVQERWFEVVGASETKGHPFLYRLSNPEENAREAVTVALFLGGTLVDGKVLLEVSRATIIADKLNSRP